MHFNPQLALEQFADLFRLMQMQLEEEEGPEALAQRNALNRLIKITDGAGKKAGAKGRTLAEILQIEAILERDLKHYPVAKLTEKLLDTIREHKSAF